jgi:hypothetical protein
VGEQTKTARDANTRAKPRWRSPHHKQTALLLLCGIILILYPGSAFAQAPVKIETLSVATGAALDFDGLDDYVQRASSLVVGTNDFTIEAWINPVIGAGFSSIIAQDISGNAPSQFEVALHLSNASNATISDADGTGTITNDDVASTPTPTPTPTPTETDVTLSGGILTITDANGGTTDDTLTISRNGSNVRIHDPNHTLSAGAGTTQFDANTVDVPLSSITGNIQVNNIQVNTLGGNDTLTLDLSGGNFETSPPLLDGEFAATVR